VSKIIDGEPKHWHDANGKHNMTDPRTIDGWTEKMWDADERAYVAHLREHENDVPEREDDDPAEVSALFDLIEHNEVTNAKLRMLIGALRMRDLRETEIKETQ
jgi:hypothetical protein